MSPRIEHLSDGVELHLGDCREILPTLGKVDAVVTDPPYEFIPMGGGLGGKRQVYKDIYAQKLHEGFDPKMLLGISDSLTVLCAKAQLRELIEFGESNRFRWNLTTFNKTNPTPLCGANYLPDAEYIFHFWRGVRLGGGYADKSRFWTGPSSGDSKIHPTIKPVGLMQKLIRVAHESTDALICDPFLGSGTTGVAAVKLGRRFVGIEVEEKYFDVACGRIAQAIAQPDFFCRAPRPSETGAVGDMNQSRSHSLLEAALSTATGFVLSMLSISYVFPAIGVRMDLAENFAATMIMTGVSLARSYFWRRVFSRYGRRG